MARATAREPGGARSPGFAQPVVGRRPAVKKSDGSRGQRSGGCPQSEVGGGPRFKVGRRPAIYGRAVARGTLRLSVRVTRG